MYIEAGGGISHDINENLSEEVFTQIFIMTARIHLDAFSRKLLLKDAYSSYFTLVNFVSLETFGLKLMYRNAIKFKFTCLLLVDRPNKV
jgi:hypothetical protein